MFFVAPFLGRLPSSSVQSHCHHAHSGPGLNPSIPSPLTSACFFSVRSIWLIRLNDRLQVEITTPLLWRAANVSQDSFHPMQTPSHPIMQQQTVQVTSTLSQMGGALTPSLGDTALASTPTSLRPRPPPACSESHLQSVCRSIVTACQRHIHEQQSRDTTQQQSTRQHTAATKTSAISKQAPLPIPAATLKPDALKLLSDLLTSFSSRLLYETVTAAREPDAVYPRRRVKRARAAPTLRLNISSPSATTMMHAPKPSELSTTSRTTDSTTPRPGDDSSTSPVIHSVSTVIDAATRGTDAEKQTSTTPPSVLTSSSSISDPVVTVTPRPIECLLPLYVSDVMSAISSMSHSDAAERHGGGGVALQELMQPIAQAFIPLSVEEKEQSRMATQEVTRKHKGKQKRKRNHRAQPHGEDQHGQGAMEFEELEWMDGAFEAASDYDNDDDGGDEHPQADRTQPASANRDMTSSSRTSSSPSSRPLHPFLCEPA